MDEFDKVQTKHYIRLAINELGNVLNQTRREPIPEDIAKAMHKAVYFLDDALLELEGSDN